MDRRGFLGLGAAAVAAPAVVAEVLQPAPARPARTYSFNGKTWDRVTGDTSSGLEVDTIRLPVDLKGGVPALGEFS